MKKHGLRKLNLSRETLIPLNSDDLDAIHGGITPSLSVTLPICSNVTVSASQQSASQSASQQSGQPSK
jgi:hypothetical protein